MERNKGADDFADCIVKRSNWDIIIKIKLLVLILIVPMAFSLLAMGAYTLLRDSPSVGDSLLGGSTIALSIEFSIVSFILYCFVRRSRNHRARDIIWMDALIEYVSLKGYDASNLRTIRDKEAEHSGTPIVYASFVMWIVTVIFIVAMGMILYQWGPANERNGMLYVIAASYILLMVQFFITLGMSYRFPHRHDSVQAEFTREFSRTAEGFGLHVPPMEGMVPKPNTLVNIVLFVLTFGLYSIFLLLVSCYSMNKHIYAQWDYEEKLLGAIIDHEGGKGIEGAGAQSGNQALRFLRNTLVRSDHSADEVCRPAVGDLDLVELAKGDVFPDDHRSVVVGTQNGAVLAGLCGECGEPPVDHGSVDIELGLVLHTGELRGPLAGDPPMHLGHAEGIRPRPR